MLQFPNYIVELLDLPWLWQSAVFAQAQESLFERILNFLRQFRQTLLRWGRHPVHIGKPDHPKPTTPDQEVIVAIWHFVHLNYNTSLDEGKPGEYRSSLMGSVALANPKQK